MIRARRPRSRVQAARIGSARSKPGLHGSPGLGKTTHRLIWTGADGGSPGPGLDQFGAEGKAGQVGAAAAAGLVPDVVQVGADRADADVQLGGDLGVGAARVMRVTSSRSRVLSCLSAGPGAGGCCGPGPVRMRRDLQRRPGSSPRRVPRPPAPHRVPAPAGPRAAVCCSRTFPGLILARIKRGIRGPQRDGLGVAPGRGAQAPAAVQVDRVPGAGPAPAGVLLAGAPRRLPGTARSQVQRRHPSRVGWLTGRPAPRVAASAAAQTRSAAAKSPAWVSTSASIPLE